MQVFLSVKKTIIERLSNI